MNRKLRELVAKLEEADTEIMAHLRGTWPVGTDVEVVLMHGQKNFSRGRVVDHVGGRFGYLLIEMLDAKEGRLRFRTLPADAIMGVTSWPDRSMVTS
ncbi:MAG: hypothetical protein ACREBN_10550 [Burkholderiaceae bacterium]